MSLSRLRWRSRRGMKELDVLLNRWLDRRGESASIELLATYERLLECEDAELWPWMLGRGAPSEPELRALVEDIRATA